jgi:hypothetical protein
MSGDIPLDALTEELGGSADGSKAVDTSQESESGESTPESSDDVRTAISQALGKEYKSAEDALNAIKETQNFVGEAGKYKKLAERVASQFGGDLDEALNKLNMDNETSAVPEKAEEPSVVSPTDDLQKQVEELRFLSENPDLKPHMDTLRELKGTTGKTLTEVADSDIFQKVKAQDEASQQKKVLQPNSRLGSATDAMGKARELVNENPKAAQKMAVDATVSAIFGK